MDIGCGNGELTKTLATNINHKRVIGIDIDPNMISFANQYNKTDSMEYLIQDMSKPFDELIPQLKQLESRVGLIYANYSLHFYPNKRQIFEILSTLLSKSGTLYANITLIPDLKQYLSDESKKLIDKYLDLNSTEKEIAVYKQSINQNGLKIEKFLLSEFTLLVPESQLNSIY